MIEYTDTDSPYFELNQSELNKLIAGLDQDKIEIVGWCNAFGYDILIKGAINNWNYEFTLNKYQQSNQDPIIPRNARNHFNLKGKFSTDFTNSTFVFNGSLLDKLTLNRVRKDCGPIYTNQKSNHDFLQKLERVIRKHLISKIKIKNATGSFEANSPGINLQVLIKDLSELN